MPRIRVKICGVTTVDDVRAVADAGADAVGLNVVSGPNVGQTSAPAEPLALAASFDPAVANVLGQVEGLEGRQLMATGLYGPEAEVCLTKCTSSGS